MKKMPLAIAILFSMGLSACSSNGSSDNNPVAPPSGGSMSTDLTPTPTPTPTPDPEPEIFNKTAQVTSYFADKVDSASYKYLTDAIQYNEFVSKAKAAEALPAICSNAGTSRCRAGTVEVGTVIGGKNNSYSGYAAIRETHGLADQGIPTNAFAYYVDTPTTNNAAILDATYKGQVSWTRGNGPAINTYDSLTMTVKNGQVSGVATRTQGNTNVVTYDAITFNTADITVSDTGATFSGTANFLNRYFNTSAEDNMGTVAGTYKGAFAGTNAEEVVGTFETDPSVSATSVQGAFSATK
ncbi:hypothetical protein A4G20_04080 [Pasteurellaceae bacterium RH1A]|nr:hypothetical protein A4G20_04080 [Pasteurellaceae bacterium RH1A]